MRSRSSSGGIPWDWSCGTATRRAMVAVSLAAASLAQDAAPAPMLPEPPGPASGTVDVADVYLNDSFEVRDALAKAREFAAANRWREAAREVQEAANRFPRSLVRIEPGYFVGARRGLADVVASWPIEGLNAYRDLYDDELERAASMIDARDYPRRLELFDRFFCTRGAVALADSIARHAIEDGDFALADYVYRRTLDRHPDAFPVREQLMAGIEMSRAMQERLGSSSEPYSAAKPGSGEPRASRPDERESSPFRGPVRWKGHDRSVADVLTDIETTFGPATGPDGDAGDWPIFGGAASRNRIPSFRIDELGLLWRWSYDELAGGERRPVEPRNDDPADDEEAAAGDPSVQPVVAGGLIVAQVGASVAALHRASGEIAWQFQLDGAPTGREALEAYPPGWDSVTVARGRVYASLPNVHAVAAGGGSTLRTHELVCLSLRDGGLLWRFDGGSGSARFAETHFDTSPVVTGSRVLVVGRRTRSFGFEDSYLYIVHADTGALESVVHLGSASTGGFGSRSLTRSVITVRGSMAYVANNLGSAAALSPHSGDVLWLRTYARHRSATGDVGSRFERRVGSWQQNPVFTDDARLAALPTDAASLMILDPADGRLLRAVTMDEAAGLEMALGLRGRSICGVGREAACLDVETGERTWSSPFPESAPIAGRGVWTTDRLWVPTTKSLVGFDPGGGATAILPWDAEGEGGNLLALGDELIVAGPRTLSAYVRKSDVWRGLRDRLAASPDDPAPALELAEVALRSGERGEALASLAEAARRESLPSGASDSAVRSRIFRDALTFATVLSERGTLDEPALARLFDLAERYAADTMEHATYRFRFGDLFQRFQRPDRAARLFQQVLQDRSLRDLAMPGAEPTGAARAGAEAQARIEALIERFGPEPYAPFEADARRLFEAARAVSDAAVLTRLVESYPNSESAPLALVSLGESAAAQRHPDVAARYYVQAYQRYPRFVEQPRLMKRIADAYESAGRRDLAYLWLTKASREHPGWTLDTGGRATTWKDLLASFDDARDRVEPRRPGVSPPLPTRYTRSLEEGSLMMTPRFAEHPAHRWRAMFVSSPDGVRAVDPRTGRDLWSAPVQVRQLGDLLLATDDLAIFAGVFDIMAVSMSDGRVVWQTGPGDQANANLAGDWEGGQSIRLFDLWRDRMVVVRESGAMSAIDVATGAVQWTRSHKPPVGPMRVTERWIAYHVIEDGAAMIWLIDAAGGERIHAIATTERRPIEDLFVTLDDQVVVVTSRSLAGHEPSGRRPRWELGLSGQLRRSSLLLDLDAVYFSTDGGDLLKVSLDDGRLMWQTDRALSRDAPDLAMGRAGSSLIVAAGASVTALDPVTGMMLWKGTTQSRPKLRHAILLRDYVLALDLAERQPNEGPSLLFYDHRHASGVIPDGGMVRVGDLDDIRGAQAFDGAIVIQSGANLHGFVEN